MLQTLAPPVSKLFANHFYFFSTLKDLYQQTIKSKGMQYDQKQF